MAGASDTNMSRRIPLPVVKPSDVEEAHAKGNMLLSQGAWRRVLSDVFAINIESKIDSVDITWADLDWALIDMEVRDVTALEARYGENLTLLDVAHIIGRRDLSGPLSGSSSRENARQVIQRALMQLRHPSRVRVIRAAIVAVWSLDF